MYIEALLLCSLSKNYINTAQIYTSYGVYRMSLKRIPTWTQIGPVDVQVVSKTDVVSRSNDGLEFWCYSYHGIISVLWPNLQERKNLKLKILCKSIIGL